VAERKQSVNIGRGRLDLGYLTEELQLSIPIQSRGTFGHILFLSILPIGGCVLSRDVSPCESESC
jgi:hypothetical protein